MSPQFSRWNSLPSELQHSILEKALPYFEPPTVTISIQNATYELIHIGSDETRAQISYEYLIPKLCALFYVNSEIRKAVFWITRTLWRCLIQVKCSNGRVAGLGWLYFNSEHQTLQIHIADTYQSISYETDRLLLNPARILQLLNPGLPPVVRSLHINHATYLHWVPWRRIIEDNLNAFQSLTRITMSPDYIESLRVWDRPDCLRPNLSHLLPMFREAGAAQLYQKTLEFTNGCRDLIVDNVIMAIHYRPHTAIQHILNALAYIIPEAFMDQNKLILPIKNWNFAVPETPQSVEWRDRAKSLDFRVITKRAVEKSVLLPFRIEFIKNAENTPMILMAQIQSVGLEEHYLWDVR
ncbi:hypothetical protein K505DRAFT_342286 [Melanomma pulvis-pyrius CBS 109.77]|uniref:2EXR domain-containing protein n=1 Tax=Melanomma pulvis-pyrius CBS 109.77 TaxID=1314802 RepID=A0A6A6WWD4_9PLEO|nr:hypothetical protein K505DRAFT_342286 [Melanomma pulvis-pyrius CBS 109.77]